MYFLKDFLTHINCQNYICKQNKWYVLTIIPLECLYKTGWILNHQFKGDREKTHIVYNSLKICELDMN